MTCTGFFVCGAIRSSTIDTHVTLLEMDWFCYDVNRKSDSPIFKQMRSWSAFFFVAPLYQMIDTAAWDHPNPEKTEIQIQRIPIQYPESQLT